MTPPIVHIVSFSKQYNFLIASAVIVLEPSCQIVEHSSYAEYRENVDHESDAAWQIVAADMAVEASALDPDSLLIPIVYFKNEKGLPGLEQATMAPPFPVYVGEIKPYLMEAIASATLFKKLSLGLQKLAELNDRESSVMTLAAQGIPNKTIARRLDVSIKTIEQSRRNAYSKLGIKSAAEVGSLVTFKKLFAFFGQSMPAPSLDHSVM